MAPRRARPIFALGTMAIDDTTWAKVALGDEVVTAAHEPIGTVIAVAPDRLTVRDPHEGRVLDIPRSAFASRRRRKLRLARHPIQSLGFAPERFAPRETLDDDWVPEQTNLHTPVTVESDHDPAHGHREGSPQDVGDARDNAPTEIE